MSHRSGSGPCDDQKTGAVCHQVREQKQLQQLELDIKLNGFLGMQVASFYDRDIELVQERINAIEAAFGDAALNVDRLLFGGSVAKHTYVDGLSDIDALVVLDEPEVPPMT